MTRYVWYNNRWQDAESYLTGVYTMVNEDPNYAARQEVMSLYRSAQDVHGRLAALRRSTEDAQLHLSQAQQDATLLLAELSHWLHELDKGPLMTEVSADVVQLELTEPESRAAAIEDYKRNHHA